MLFDLIHCKDINKLINLRIASMKKISSLIPKLDHVFKFLGEEKWGSSSGLKISAAVGVLSAAGIIFAVKDKVWNVNSLLLSSDSDSGKYWTVPGLQNFGNNCFLNVILQALASCSSFRKYLEKTMEEFKFSSETDGVESMPLLYALASLMEELGTVRHGRTVLSPRKLMLAMDNYIPSFSLTSQQDAEEAFSHLLSSLREELSEHYVPGNSYLADLAAPPHPVFRIANFSIEQGEWQRWWQSFLGPFDGIIGSILICQSCSFQISLDFQLFHSLHLLPPISHNAATIEGCSLEDCLKQFLVAEHVENYCCSHCWHSAAIKYVSAVAEDKILENYKVVLVMICVTAKIFLLFNNFHGRIDSAVLSSNSALHGVLRMTSLLATSQRGVSRVDAFQILCIHVQRASANVFGQPQKLEGHLSFPLSLDLSLFMKSEVGIKKSQDSLQFKQSKNQSANTPLQMGVVKESERNTTVSLPEGNCLNSYISGPSLLKNGRVADTMLSGLPTPSSSNKVGPSEPRIYRLVSVVEHFGTVGSGHYTVYRRVIAKIGAEDPVSLLESAMDQWFCISDSQVRSVSEEEVLSANASMLFYEKLVQH